MADTDNVPAIAADTDGVTRKHGLFENIDGESIVNEVESLCMNCHENGTTRFMMVKIPHFKQVVLMAFKCDACGFNNNEIQSAKEIAEKGFKITLLVTSQKDLDRQCVKTEKGIIHFPEIDLSIAPSSGSLSTIEGILKKAVAELEVDQTARLSENYDTWKRVQEVIEQLHTYLTGSREFSITLDDPTGNSYIENPLAPSKDPQLTYKHYERTRKQNEALGMYAQNDGRDQQEREGLDVDLQHDIHTFFDNCSRCSVPCETKMHMLEIPHFKEVIVMSTVCESCGYKSNEIKAGGAISKLGRKISLVMTSPDDLSRDILKSETCGLKILEVELELEAGTLGGRFTTIEGLLTQVYEELDGKAAFRIGDSVDPVRKLAFDKFLLKLKRVLEIKEGDSYTLELNDPMGNSYLQNLYAPDPDVNMKTEDYTRSWEVNEEWGLNDMKTENYENDQ